MEKSINLNELQPINEAVFICKALNITSKAAYVAMQIQLPQFSNISWEMIEDALVREQEEKQKTR